jgi:hypothetical protein
VKSKDVLRNREIPRKSGSRKGTSYVPYPQRERIKQEFIQGKNISAIARQEGRHWETISKIVKEADVLEHVKNLRAQFFGGLEEALQLAFDYIRNSKDGGKLAYEMLKDAGVVPSNCQKLELELQAKQPDPESERAAIKRTAVALVEGAIERHKFFGLPLPEADEVEQSLLEKEKAVRIVREREQR